MILKGHFHRSGLPTWKPWKGKSHDSQNPLTGHVIREDSRIPRQLVLKWALPWLKKTRRTLPQCRHCNPPEEAGGVEVRWSNWNHPQSIPILTAAAESPSDPTLKAAAESSYPHSSSWITLSSEQQQLNHPILTAAAESPYPHSSWITLPSQQQQLNHLTLTAAAESPYPQSSSSWIILPSQQLNHPTLTAAESPCPHSSSL